MDVDPKFFNWLFLVNFSTFTTYGIGLSFFPNISKSHGLSASQTGLIFSFYPLGGVVAGVILGKIMPHFKKKNLIYIFLFSLICSILMFGLADLIENEVLFIIVCAFSRFLQGLSAGAYETIAYSYVPIIWPNEMERKLGILEISAGLGIGFGPVLGSAFYLVYGYLSIFVIQSIYIITIGVYSTYYHFPDSINMDEENSGLRIDKIEESMSIKECLSHKNILFLCFVLCFDFTTFTVVMTDFENKVIEKGGNAALCSLLFCIGNIGYIISILYLGTARKRFGKTFCLVISIILDIGALFLFGIDLIFNLEHIGQLFVFFASGNFIMGFANSIAIILFIPQAISIFNKMFSDKYTNEQKCDMACGIYTTFLSFAELIGPIVGGFFADTVGFSTGCYIYAIFMVAFLVCYLKIGEAFSGISNFRSKISRKGIEIRKNLIEMENFERN